MSLKSVENLTANMAKTSVQLEDLVAAVNDTLGKFETHFQDNSHIYNLHRHIFKEQKSPAVMQSEKVILCEINAGLWDKAVTSAIYSLTRHTYPHYIIIQEFINYLLNSQSDTNFGSVEELFNSLLLSHPPKPEMFDYYKAILCDYFIVLNEKTSENSGSFFCLLKALSSCLQIPKNLRVSEENNESVKNQRQHFLEVIDQIGNENLNDFSFAKMNNKNLTYFEKLPWIEKVKRCLISLNFIYKIFESDFAFWLQSNKSKTQYENNRPLLSHVLWPETTNVGLITRKVNKILNIYQLVIESSDFKFPNAEIVDKLVSLVAELIRVSDHRKEIKYPFLGTNSVNYSRELSKTLSNRLIELSKKKKLPDENAPIIKLKPPWFRLLLCSHTLSFITGYQCPPELTGACDLLEHIAMGKIDDEGVNVEKAAKVKTLVNLEMVEKFRKIRKNLNAKHSEGKTVLQSACENNETEKIKALLTFPELDVNATDSNGWTALHLAASKGHASSVQELLLFRPKQNVLQKGVNARARGPESTTPLMCAAREGHAHVCRLLLEHAGSILLDHVNDFNQTPMELSKNKEVTSVLKHYKNNFVYTVQSHNFIDLKPEHIGLVSRICVEMIQSYFCTHRTWDVYRALKKLNKSSSVKTLGIELEANPEWDYVRYNRDIKTNIGKLRRLVPKLEKVEEFKSSLEIYTRILSFSSVV